MVRACGGAFVVQRGRTERGDCGQRGLRRLLSCVLIAVFACMGVAVLAPSANAACRNVYRGYPDGSSALVIVCDPVGDRPAPRPSKPAKAEEATKAQYRTLRYVPRETISAEVRDELAGQLAVGPKADVIRAEVQSGVYLTEVGARMRKLGWSTRNLGDMYAYSYVVMWLAVHNRRQLSGKVANAVRADLRRELALDASVRRAGDAAQQAHAERVASWAVAVSSRLNAARATGDPALVRDAQRSARDVARGRDQLGVDLEDVRPTSNGAIGNAGGPRVER